MSGWSAEVSRRELQHRPLNRPDVTRDQLPFINKLHPHLHVARKQLNLAGSPDYLRDLVTRDRQV